MSIKDSPLLRKILTVLPSVLAVLAVFFSIIATHKHVDETRQYQRQYYAGYNSLTRYVSTLAKKNEFERISYVISVRDEAIEKLDEVREAVAYFEKIKPPKKLRAEHNALLKSISRERDFLDRVEQTFRAHTTDMLKTAVHEVVELADGETAADGFPNRLDEFIQAMERENSKSSRRHLFIWI